MPRVRRGAGRRLIPLAPPPSSLAISAAMRGNRSADTKPELIVRRTLHRLGYRYRLHVSGLPGRPDIVLAGIRRVIQIRGCFWHQHSDRACPLRSRPRSNVAYWNAKLDRNVERDKEQDAQLCVLGWRVLTIWECETTSERLLRRKLRRFLEGATPPT
jgi:DNA mismatch endonuclease, patch repair protein